MNEPLHETCNLPRRFISSDKDTLRDVLRMLDGVFGEPFTEESQALGARKLGVQEEVIFHGLKVDMGDFSCIALSGRKHAERHGLGVAADVVVSFLKAKL